MKKLLMLVALLSASAIAETKEYKKSEKSDKQDSPRIEYREETCHHSGYCYGCGYHFGKGYRCGFGFQSRCRGKKTVTFENGVRKNETSCR